MDLILMVGGTFVGLMLSYQLGSRYPKHFAVFCFLLTGAGVWWILRLWGKI